VERASPTGCSQDRPRALRRQHASHLAVKIPDKQLILETPSVTERLEKVLGLIESEISVLQVEKRIRTRVKRPLRVHPSCLVENVNSGHSLPRERRRRCWPTRTGILLEVSAAMACPSGRVGEQLERHADKHRFPMRIRPGDRPPVQRSANRPLMWNCCRH
jgi:hypothetical protein